MDQPVEDGPYEGFTLGDAWAIVQMQRRVVFGALLVCFAVAVVYSIAATRLYSATAVVHLTLNAGQEIDTERVVNEAAAWNRQMFVSTQIAVLESRRLRQKVLERYEELGVDDDLQADDAGAGVLAGAIEINPRKGTELVDITVTMPDPEQAARLANLVSVVFRDESLAASTDAAIGAKAWLAAQLSDYETRISTASADLVEYERANDMADAEDAETSLASKMTALNGAYGSITTERVMQETTVNNYERWLKEGNYEQLAKQMGTPLIGSLTSRYADAVTEHARIAAFFGEKMPERKSSDAELARIEAEIRAEVEHTLAAERAKLKLLKAKEADITTELDGGKSEMLDVQTKREVYEKKRLEVQNAKDFYHRLRERMDELELQSKTQLNRVRIVEEAQPPKHASYPFVPLNLGIGLLSGLVLGLGGAFLREWFDDSISSPLDVSTYLRVPFLGIVPKIGEEADEIQLALHTHYHPRSTIAESVRAIRTILELNPLGDVPKRMLIASAVSSEGKTSTAVRLAIAFANLDRKVLVVDGDLRRPRVHKIFAADREPGLTSVLEGQAELAAVVRPTPIPNLFYMPSGRTGERPNELLASPAFPRVLEEMGKQFDHILIDSPPSVIMSDARILSRHVDGVVMVVREHATSRALVREAVQGFEQVGGRVLGVVINAVDFARRRTTYKYYYGYGYRYDKYYDDSQTSDAAAK